MHSVYGFPNIHPYKLILIVLRKFIVYCRIFLHFFIKSDVFNSAFSAAMSVLILLRKGLCQLFATFATVVTDYRDMWFPG